jgi:hypothetical protein
MLDPDGRELHFVVDLDCMLLMLLFRVSGPNHHITHLQMFSHPRYSAYGAFNSLRNNALTASEADFNICIDLEAIAFPCNNSTS